MGLHSSPPPLPQHLIGAQWLRQLQMIKISFDKNMHCFLLEIK